MHEHMTQGDAGGRTRRHPIDDENYPLEICSTVAEARMLELIQGRFGRFTVNPKKEAVTFKLHRSPQYQGAWEAVINFLKARCNSGARYGKFNTQGRSYDDMLVSFTIQDWKKKI